MALVVAGALALMLSHRAGIIGIFNDDSYYAVGARSLATGHGYHLPSSPDNPAANRFPIGFPAILAALWRLWPEPYAAVAAWETMVALCAAVFLLGSYWLLTRVWRVQPVLAAAGVALVGYHPLAIKYGSAVMSDFPFALAALAALAIAERVRTMKPAPVSRGQERGRVVILAAALAATCLIRYAGVVALFAVGLALWFDGRRRTALEVICVAGVFLAPWLYWVAQNRAFDYANQVVQSGAGRAPMVNLLAGSCWFAFQALPGLLAPGLFLPHFSEVQGLASTNTETSWLGNPAGILISVLLLWPLVRELALPQRRIPALYVLSTCLLAALWSGSFRTLNWDLEIRLLLPVAPLLLALSLEGWWQQFKTLPAGSVRSVSGLLTLSIAFYLACDRAALNRKLGLEVSKVHENAALLFDVLAHLQYVSPRTPLAAIYPPTAYFYTGKAFYTVLPDPRHIELARSLGIRLLLAAPAPFGPHGEDLTWKAVMAAQKLHPDKVKIAYVAAPRLALVALLP